MVSRSQGGCRQCSDWIWTLNSTARHGTVFTHGMEKEKRRKLVMHRYKLIGFLLKNQEPVLVLLFPLKGEKPDIECMRCRAQLYLVSVGTVVV